MSSRSRIRIALLSGSLLTLAATVPLAGQSGSSGPCVTYATVKDFSQGELFNLEVVRDPATGQQCLRLVDNHDVRPWPFLAVAVSGFTQAASGDPGPWGQIRRGSIIRIATENLPQYGLAEGDVVGEYFTAPEGMATNPSRTTVDGYGNIWVGNRNEASPAVPNGPNMGSVTRVGLALGGTRVNANGVPDPTGDYLQGPFAYCTCEDRDGDGLIRTSRGYPHTTGAFNVDYAATALPWTNLPGGIDTAGGVVSAQDECITAFVRTEGVNIRHVSIDGSNDIWVGSWTNKRFEKLDNATATQVGGSPFTALYGGYGGLVDACGVLWSANWDAGAAGNQLMRYDPATNSLSYFVDTVPPDFDYRNYGLAFDPATCFIWMTYPYDGLVRRVTPSGAPLPAFNHGSSATNRGIAIDGGDVWIANSSSNTVSRISTAGVAAGLVPVNFGSIPGSTPHGVAVDSNGKVWATNRVTHNAVRIDPALGAFGATDLAVDLGPDAWAYNYSDQTGDMLLKTAPQGTWTFIHDGGKTGCVWSTLDWTAMLTGGSQVIVRVRASDSPLPSGPWTTVQANVPFTGVVGRYLQVQVTLKRGTVLSGECCRPVGEAMLCDLTICKEASCTVDVDKVRCATDGSGNVSVTFTVNNNSGQDASHVLITPMPPGSPVTPSPNVISQFIPDGSSATFTVNFSGTTSGVPFCFIVTLLDTTMQNCCSTEICVEPDCDCLQVTEGSESIKCDPNGQPGTYTYTFQLDNLTPDIIHHLFLIPPGGSGVTITPNYMALTPPIPPYGTSLPITVTITGATPGSLFCFAITIHDINLNECCSREHCIEIPLCGGEEPEFGACCYHLHGVPQPICTVMTFLECETLGGMWMGAQTSCSPNPCIPADPTDGVHLTAAATCCWPQTSTVTVTLTICNSSSAGRSYNWSIASVPGPNCNHIIAPNFIMPTGGTANVAPGGCVSVPITIFCEGLVGDGVMKACLQALVTNLGSGNQSSATGVVNWVNTQSGLPVPRWCFDVAVPDDHGPPIPLVIGNSADLAFEILNAGDADGAISFQVASGGVLSVNGLPPGTVLSSYAGIDSGHSLLVPLEAAFDEHVPLQVFDVVLLTDLDSDGHADPVSSIGLLSVLKPTCPGDIDCDGHVNFSDLVTLLAAWGPCPACSTDLDGNGTINFDDLLILLAAWGPCAG
ncbi:MAG: hypothetical protein KF817_03425 [Phycisphaeraceae bacterium]|nr:hypothetical protein [Phycisphaeraceae bacterium]